MGFDRANKKIKEKLLSVYNPKTYIKLGTNASTVKLGAVLDKNMRQI